MDFTGIFKTRSFQLGDTNGNRDQKAGNIQWKKQQLLCRKNLNNPRSKKEKLLNFFTIKELKINLKYRKRVAAYGKTSQVKAN
ncbi:hypothetical protein AAG747_24920 [Rapidithrix thailandica]|uniref:Uncharacterized protein n=1 Tax=Rapidithrix thailandica TaxID=413964 RepID=A0AAW9SE27_9BACT